MLFLIVLYRGELAGIAGPQSMSLNQVFTVRPFLESSVAILGQHLVTVQRSTPHLSA